MTNLMLFKLWIFNIEFSTLISFIVGVFTGMLILLLIYVLIVLSSLRTKDFLIKTQKDDLTTQEVKQMVSDTQLTYKDKTLRGELTRFGYCEQLSKDLAYGIAIRFYPDSKHPFLELSVAEVLLLTNYITGRIDEILNRRIFKMFRKLKVSTVVELTNKKKEIEESKAFKATVSVGKKVSKLKYVLNVINPVNLVKKLVVDNILNLITDKICVVIIGIVGEETYKIYSKKVFDKDVSIDTGTEEIIEEMSESIKDAAKEIEDDNSGNNNFLKKKIYKMAVSNEKLDDAYDYNEPIKKKL